MASRLTRVALIFLGLALLALGASLWWLELAGPRVNIDEPDELAVDRSGETTVVGFTVHNPTWHAVQVVGIAEC
jgi:hypothetical protein